jgi:chitodextrinase
LVAAASAPADSGQWSSVLSWPVIAVHTSLLPNGKLLLFQDVGSYVFDPATNTMTAAPFNLDLFCAGHALLPDGRVFVAGGNVNNHIGLHDSSFFNPTAQSWSSGAKMLYGRWYPTVTELADGRMLVTGGETTCNDCNAPIPEIYDPATNAWTQLSGALRDFPYYPHQFLLPDGRVLVSSTNRRAIASAVLDLATQAWTTVDLAVREGGSAAMYAPGKIIKSGLARDPDISPANSVATTYVLDMNQPIPAWRQTASMAFPRTQHNLTLLPDGTVLAIGGSRNSNVGDTPAAVLEPELWSPSTETWTALAAMQTPRMYHSTAVLLPDGRVLVAGGGKDAPEVDQRSAEFFSPPYLFRGTRPAITSAPAAMQYGSGFFVGTPDSARIASVSLLGLGSVTHAFDENQRFVPLSFQPVVGGLTIQAPASGNLAPPGNYMLFILDTNGVPSVAPMIKMNSGPPDTQPPTAPTNLIATAASASQINLSWTASTDNLGVTSYLVERCAGAGCGNFAQITPVTGTTYNNAGLTAGTTYGYRVRATDAANNPSGYSNVASATTSAPDAQPPTAPTALAATAISASQINLAWTAATDNVGVASYLVERCAGAGCASFAQITTVTGTSYSNTGLSASTSYSYRVRAADAANNLSGYSNVASAVTTAAVGGLVAAYAFSEGAGTTIADVSGKGHSGTINGATWTATGKYGKALSFNGTTNFVDLGNAADLQIAGSMTVSAWINATANPADDGQIISKSSGPGWQLKTSPDTGPHTFGVSVSPSSTSNTQRYSTTVRQLNTWYHVAGVYDAAARTLNIYVNGVLDNGVLIGTVPASQYNAPQSVNIGRRTGGYYFNGTIDELRLYNRSLTQSEIQADMNTPLAAVPDTQPPTAPTALAATAISPSQVNLVWTASTDNVGVSSYLVERCQDAGCGNFAQIIAVTGTTYSNTALNAGTSYSYRVRATDAAGNPSGYSNVSSVTTPVPDTQPPSAPSSLTATAVSTSQINLAWTASTDNVGVTSYLVERCAGAGCATFAQITTVPGTTFSNTGLAANTSYSYRVRATDAAGNPSGYSNVASAVTQAAATGLVAAYGFNEGTGTTTADATGKGHTGMLSGATWTATGKYGRAISFNGTTGYVDLGNAADLQITGSMTWSAWIFATANPADDGQIISKSGASGWQFKTSPDTGLHTFGVSVSPNSTSMTQRYSKTVRALNTWYHVAGVYNAAARTLDIYVNGVLDNGVLIGTVPASQYNAPQNVNIGRRTGGYYFKGTIDEVRIYNRALSQAEIQADMNSAIGGP